MGQNELLKVTQIPINKEECVWSGRPCIIPYLLLNRRLFTMSIAVLSIWCFFEFQWFIGTQIWTAFYIICIISSMRRWFRIRYYITNSGLVVKSGKTHFILEWKKARRQKYRVINNLLEIIWGCRTIQYAENRGYHVSRGSNTDLWREVTRFWCIKDYKKVNEIITKQYNVIEY